jgi:predicted permease
MTFYDLLLRLYPASFRNEYAAEMRPLFAQRWRAAHGLAGVGLWVGTIGEVLYHATGAHVDILKQDLGYTARLMRRTPGFAVTAVLIVALGIGATTASFSVADFVLLRPLQFPEPDRLVQVWQTTPGYSRMELSPPNYRDWKAAAKSFDSMGMYFGTRGIMTPGGEARQFDGASVTADVIPTLGVMPALGRTFMPEEDREGASPTIILSYQFWQRELGGDANVLGRAVVMDSLPHTVIGVMPREFHFPYSETMFWVTTRFGEGVYQNTQRTNNMLNAVARLRDGVTIEQARAEMNLLAAQSRQQYPKENENTGASVLDMRAEIPQRSRLLLIALAGASGCVLLIACANLANLLLVRALARRRELAVRSAMGAGRERLVRQLMTESLLVAVAGGAIGIAIAVAAVPLLAQLAPTSLPTEATPSVDFRVLLFAVLLTGMTGVVFGLAPVLRVGGSPDLDGLREGARAGSGQKERLRSALVVAEIVASVVLLVSTGLLVRALVAVQAVDPGFKAEGVLTLRTPLPNTEYRTVAAREAFYGRVLQEVRALPGVTAAGYISFLPMSSFRGGIWPISVKGDAQAASDTRSATNVAGIRYVTPGFFNAMGMSLVRGRDVAESDSREGQRVAVVSESFVRRYWPNEDPIGRRFAFGFEDPEARAEREVVGVVRDVRFRGLERTSEPQVYLSSQQVADRAIVFYAPRSVAIRTTGDPAALAPAVRSIVKQADAKIPVTELQTLTDLVGRETSSRAVQVRVLAAFAAIAFVLAAIGIHGLLSFAVSQRTQEIGVRIALGARSGDILSMVVGRLLVLASAGVVVGVFLAYLAGRSMEALLAGVKPADAPTLAAAVTLALLMTVIGSVAPTLRAIRVDPIVALRSE